MKKYFAILAFCFLLFIFSTPAHAQLDCGAYGFEENGCCNYGEATLNPYHITADDPRCNANYCERRSFDDPTFPYTDCNYCHRDNLCMRKDNAGGCAGICNNVCCVTTPPDEEEEVCPLPNYETDPCCPLEIDASSISIPERLIGYILSAKIVFKENELRHAYVEKLKLRHYGQKEGEGGAMRKLMPPNHPYIQSEDERQRVDTEQGAWGIKTGDGRGGVMGADPFLFQLNYAADFLGKALTPPTQEGDQVSSRGGDEELCNSTALTQVSNQKEEQGTVLAAEEEELCHDVLPGPKHSACVAQNEVEISLGEAVGGVLGRIKLFPSFSFLRNIFTRTLGSGAEGEPAGYFRIFDLPGEEHEKLDGETEKGRFEVQFSILGIPLLSLPINAEMRGVWNTGTEAEVDEKIQQKLTPPTAEDITSGYQTPEIRTAAVYSQPTVLANAAVVPQNTSLAERIGHTIGSWLAKLMAL